LLPMFDGDVEPLNEYLEAAGVDPQEFIGQFYPSIADVAMVDGELRWIPIHVNTQIGYARADLFDDPDNQARFQEEYSYALPQPDSSGHISFGSWQEIADVAQFMTMDDNSDGHPEIWGLIQAGKWGQGNTIFEDQMLRNGLSYTDEDGYSMWGERHPGNQDVIREIAEFTYNTTNTWHVSSPGILSMQMTEVNSLFMEGKAAMTFTWNVDFWSKLKEGSDFADTYGQPYTWGFEFLNEGTDNKGFISIYCYGLSSQSENKDAVVQFLLQMADEGLRREAHSTAALPCPNGMVDVSQWAVEQELVPAGYPAAIDSVGLMWPTSPGWPETELLRDVTREHREKLLAGDITPDEFVTLTAQNVENVMREAGYIE
jgi:ABC-type glycerol-3-phosphate transport system substrate-binding protein